MFFTVPSAAVPYDRYAPLAPPETTAELKFLAQELKGLRVLHVNSTAAGGGVAEILQSMVPLMKGLGIDTDRIVIDPPPEFFQVTKQIHNLLQGAEGSLSPEDLQLYLGSIREVAEHMRRSGLTADVWFIHDPQVLPLARFLPRGIDQTWIWTIHIDLTTPNKDALDALMPYTRAYDRLIFSLDSYVPAGLDKSQSVSIAPPAIDPLTVKNTPMDREAALKLVSAMGVDPARPLALQVSRFDLWKDPWGVIDAFRLARREVPGLQLALLGLTQANDDPEAVEVVSNVADHAEQDLDIHLYFDPAGLPAGNDDIVNAFQVAADVVLQKSLREGFGLTVTEAMWKGQPVIGGNVGGIRLQIKDGVNGYLVDSPEQAARRMVQLVQDPALRSRLGSAARETVRERFLMPSLALDYLRVVRAHVHRATAPAPGAPSWQTNPRYSLA